jgi:hypothetical protein
MRKIFNRKVRKGGYAKNAKANHTKWLLMQFCLRPLRKTFAPFAVRKILRSDVKSMPSSCFSLRRPK